MSAEIYRPSENRTEMQDGVANLQESHEKKDLEFLIFKEIEGRLLKRCGRLESEVVALKRGQPINPVAPPVVLTSGGRGLAFEKEAIEMQKSMNEMNATLEDYRRLVAAQAGEITRLQNTITAREDQSVELRTLRDQIQLMQNLSVAQEELNNLRDEESEKNRLKSERLELQAEHLKKYAANLNEEKEWLRKGSRDLLNEVKSTTSLHPLRDYLALTKRELSKIEAELMKTPTSAPQRKGLEECVGQLIEQRGFLEQVIEGSENEVKSDASRILKILQEAQPVPIPPLLDLSLTLLKP